MLISLLALASLFGHANLGILAVSCLIVFGTIFYVLYGISTTSNSSPVSSYVLVLEHNFRKYMFPAKTVLQNKISHMVTKIPKESCSGNFEKILRNVGFGTIATVGGNIVMPPSNCPA